MKFKIKNYRKDQQSRKELVTFLQCNKLQCVTSYFFTRVNVHLLRYFLE